jgi:hypothetical protein
VKSDESSLELHAVVRLPIPAPTIEKAHVRTPIRREPEDMSQSRNAFISSGVSAWLSARCPSKLARFARILHFGFACYCNATDRKQGTSPQRPLNTFTRPANKFTLI